MITFSDDPKRAEEQMRAVILYLSALGYVDGEFDPSEKDFVRDYIRKVIRVRVHAAVPETDWALRAELTGKYTNHFLEVFEEIDNQIQSYFHEDLSSTEDVGVYVYSRIKLRCFEVFQDLDEESRKALLGAVDELIAADGVVHPNELKFRNDITGLFAAPIPIEEAELEDMTPPPVAFGAATNPQGKADDHPLFRRLEEHYSRDAEVLREQMQRDLGLVKQTLAVIERQRAAGAGLLTGKASTTQLAGCPSRLDGHVYAYMPPAEKDLDILVLGDLHGCYSCLKAALLQTDFFSRVEAHRVDPRKNPETKLVLLGDYIDRGIFSYNGVLRTVLETYLAAPDDVYVLRGNHEYYFEHEGKVYGGVRPAEAILTLQPYLPQDVFVEYMHLFEELPNMLLLDRLFFVHAGIPRDSTLAEKWKDLSTLNDPDIRFQMMWSDPSQVDFIPPQLQEESARFPFGRQQFRSFMARVGSNIMVRGHTKVDEGYRKVYDDSVVVLLNLFSAGGKTNDDLPPESTYRTVTPMALNIKRRNGQYSINPFVLDYERFNSPERNRFFSKEPEIEFRRGE